MGWGGVGLGWIELGWLVGLLFWFVVCLFCCLVGLLFRLGWLVCSVQYVFVSLFVCLFVCFLIG